MSTEPEAVPVTEPTPLNVPPFPPVTEEPPVEVPPLPVPEPEPEPKSPLEVAAACKICRGGGINLIFRDSTPYDTHLATVHPESV